jgi:hypothetical protein
MGGEEEFAKLLHGVWDWQLKTPKYVRPAFVKELANYLDQRLWEDDKPADVDGEYVGPDGRVWIAGYPKG